MANKLESAAAAGCQLGLLTAIWGARMSEPSPEGTSGRGKMSSAPLIQSDIDGQVQRGELMAKVFPSCLDSFWKDGHDGHRASKSNRACVPETVFVCICMSASCRVWMWMHLYVKLSSRAKTIKRTPTSAIFNMLKVCRLFNLDVVLWIRDLWQQLL